MSQKKSSGSFSAALTLVFVLVCAVVVGAAINLVVSGFSNAGSQPVSVAGAPSTAVPATPTVDEEDGPPPPGTPTGERWTPVPTPNQEQLENAPTAEVPPDVPTLAPTPESAGVAATLGPVTFFEPGEERITYQDPYIGFSFQYPDNWQIEGSTDLSPAQVASKGTYTIIESYIIYGVTKGGVPQNALKVDIDVSPGFAEYGTIENWFEYHKETLRDPDEPDAEPTFPNFEQFEVDGVPAIRWRTTDPGGSAAVAFGSGDWLYTIYAYPGTSDYLSTFDEIIASFNLP